MAAHTTRQLWLATLSAAVRGQQIFVIVFRFSIATLLDPPDVLEDQSTRHWCCIPLCVIAARL